MTHEDKGRFSQKHAPERRPDPRVAAAVRERSQNGEIGCAAAFAVAEEQRASPGEVGLAIDRQEITIVKCQLGLFGYKPGRSIVEPAESVSAELERAVRGALVGGRLPCAASWKIAEEQGLPKMGVSCACERLGIRISSCQLGAF